MEENKEKTFEESLTKLEEIVKSLESGSVSLDDAINKFTEAMEFLISERQDPADMLYLGGYYYDMKRFDLALKYYEMAASYDYDPAYECLGYI